MTRKKVTLEWIMNDSTRKACLKNRRIGLLQKVNELSILCDVPQPTKDGAEQKDDKSRDLPTERVSKVHEEIEKLQKKHKGMEFSNIMRYVYEGNGLDELNVTYLQFMFLFVEEKRKEIQKRVDYFQHAPLSHDSLMLAPYPPPLALATDQAAVFVPSQMAPNLGENIGESNHDNHRNAPVESTQWNQWFTNMKTNNDNIDRSSSSSKIYQMAELSAYNQPFGQSSITGNQLGFMGSVNYKSYLCGSTSVETPMGQKPFGGFRGLISTSGADMPMLLPSSPLPPHIGVNYCGRNYDGMEISLDLQPCGNVETGGNIGGGDMGLPFDHFDGNNVASDLGSPYDVTKQWPTNFNP
ncbi:hypothetical protein Q3G72_010912 [Acer saccharum]|nr:hypothetical protein Q3G72_010912 [Acer saccharum]